MDKWLNLHRTEFLYSLVKKIGQTKLVYASGDQHKSCRIFILGIFFLLNTQSDSLFRMAYRNVLNS